MISTFSMRTICFVSSALFLAVPPWHAPSASAQIRVLAPAMQSQSTSAPKGITATQRSQAALFLAKQAAEAGFIDVSFEAVRRAIGDGPPVQSAGLGGLLSGGRAQSQRVVISSNLFGGPTPTSNNDRTSTARVLQELDSIWKEKKTEPAKCYELWEALVFPPGRPNDAFPYSTADSQNSFSYSINLNEPEPTSTKSGIHSLVHWAKQADKIPALTEVLTERGKFPGAKATTDLIRIVLATFDDSIDRETLCKSLSTKANTIVTGPESEMMMSLTFGLMQKLPRDSQPRQQLWSDLKSAASTNQRWATNRWLRYAVATEIKKSAKVGDFETFNRDAEFFLSILDPLGSGNEDYVARQKSSLYGNASSQALKEGFLDFGLECLKKQSQFSSATVGSGNEIGKALLDPTGNQFGDLLTKTPEERYSLFADLVFQMPRLGLVQAANVAPFERIPDEFVSNYKSYRKTNRLPFEQVTALNSRCLSLIEWVMRDAIACGKKSEIEKRIADMERNRSDDATLAKAMFAKAEGRAINLEDFSTEEGERITIRPEVNAQRGPIMALDYEIFEAAVKDKKYREAALDFGKRLAGRSFLNRSNDVKHGRYCEATAELATDSAPLTADHLQHFTVAEDFTMKDLLADTLGESMWMKTEEGSWEHRTGVAFSSLLLKYPLQGDYKVSFECEDNTYGESAFTFGGQYVDIRGYVQNIAVDSVGLRTGKQVATSAIQRGNKNKVELVRDAAKQSYTVTINDSLVADFDLADSAFPFVGPHSMHHRKMALSNFKIEGSPTIPRELDLLDPNLLGWSNRFRYRALPPLPKIIASGAESDVSADHKEVASKSDVEGSAVVTYDWELKNSELNSVDHAALHKLDQQNKLKTKKRWHPPHEQWIYYLRPLCEGETVSCEFYYEPGKYSVHPTIDRVSLQIDRPKLRKHWITSSAKVFGISSTNGVDVPSDQVLGTHKLKAKSWNQLTYSRKGDLVTVSLNDTPIYSQQVDSLLRGRFGFLQDPEAFQVKVRNVVLTGEWPEKLPEELFAEK